MFVNIGLQNGVLLRTVLDPINGQLTDTRTRYVLCDVMLLSRFSLVQIFGNATHSPDSSTDPTKSGHLSFVFAIMAKLHPSKLDALHTSNF